MPGADPGEGFYNTNYQLFSNDDPGAGAVPNNKGFVINFKAAIASDLAKHYKDTLPGTQPSQIMGMYTPELLPILSGLAKGFAVCDAWFSSVPSMTIPNRTFALAGTSQGHMDDHIKISTSPRIFGRLSDKGLDWAIFGDGTIGEFGFDFTRFGVRVPAVLVSPLIAAGTVYRAAKGRIDHTSVLKTIHERWDTDPLTQREPGGCIAR
jgi:hypothetical protein